MIKTKFGFALLIFTILFATACKVSSKKHKQTNTFPISRNDTVYKSKNLILVRLSKHTYQHISFLNTNSFGRVSCNGMIVVNDSKSVVFDTPTDNESSEELINYVTQNLKAPITAIIPTHFHEDCVGGLEVFNKHKISSYSSNLTLQLLKKEDYKLADMIKGFDDSLTINLGNKTVIAKYFGEGHTKDNIIGYFSAENVLFGGCLIKELGANKGNLADANTKEWSSTVSKLKNDFSQVKIVIPGHGKAGGANLLEYTENLFK